MDNMSQSNSPNLLYDNRLTDSSNSSNSNNSNNNNNNNNNNNSNNNNNNNNINNNSGGDLNKKLQVPSLQSGLSGSGTSDDDSNNTNNNISTNSLSNSLMNKVNPSNNSSNNPTLRATDTTSNEEDSSPDNNNFRRFSPDSAETNNSNTSNLSPSPPLNDGVNSGNSKIRNIPSNGNLSDGNRSIESLTTPDLSSNNNNNNNNSNPNGNGFNFHLNNSDSSANYNYMINGSNESDDNQISGFIRKTFNMVSDASTADIVSWDEKTGDSFIVKKELEFSNQVLPKFFRHKNFSSFVRQLNFYGFHKRSHQGKYTKFQHPYFKRGQMQNLHLIKRKTTEQNNNFKDNIQALTATVTDLKREYDDLFTIQQQILYIFSRYLRAYPLPNTLDMNGNNPNGFNLLNGSNTNGYESGYKRQKLLYDNNNSPPNNGFYNNSNTNNNNNNNSISNEWTDLSALQEVLNSTPQGQALLAQTGLAGAGAVLASLPPSTLAALHQQAQQAALAQVNSAASNTNGKYNYALSPPLNLNQEANNLITNNANFPLDGDY